MKPKILFILHLPPPVHGAAMMGKYIKDSKIVNNSFVCHYINLAIASSLEDIGRLSIRKVLAFWRLLHLIRHKVKMFRPDLVYITPNACGGAFYKEFVIVEMLKRMGCKVVAHYHNKGVSTRQDHWFDNLLYRRFFRGLRVILLAECLYADLSGYVDRHKVYVCPNGIPDRLHGYLPMEKHHAVPHILFLSNLIVSKGVLVLLDALKILKERGCTFVCDYVGGETAEIDARRFDREVAKRGLDKQAIYHGRQYGEEKERFFQDADLLAFPTFYPNECFPLVLLEAMQHGLPCISTYEGGIADIVDDGVTGFIVQIQQAEPLADRIQQLLTNPTIRQQMGIAGHRKFQQEFTLDVLEKRFLRIIYKCLEKNVATF